MTHKNKEVHLSNLKIVVFCGEGVGRSQIASEMIKKKFPNIPIDRGGLNHPKSGRTTMHPQVVSLIKDRTGADISDRNVQKLSKEMVDENTLAIGFINFENEVPNFLTKTAFDVLLSYIGDPGDDVDNMLSRLSSKIAYYVWLTEFVINNKFEELGNNRDEDGNVIPRNLNSFLPKELPFEKAVLPFESNIGRESRAFYLD